MIVLLYMNTRSLAKTFIILLAVPFSAVGAVWLLYLLGYKMIGGIFTSFVLELVVYPAIHEIWKWHFGLKRELALAANASIF